MNCYFDHIHGHFLDYFNHPIPDDRVIYAGGIPSQYSKVEGRYTEFIDNPTGTVFFSSKKGP